MKGNNTSTLNVVLFFTLGGKFYLNLKIQNVGKKSINSRGMYNV